MPYGYSVAHREGLLVSGGSKMNASRPRKVPYTKPPISFEKQIEQLESRGLCVPDKARAEFFLSHLNYYRFAAYCLPFESDHQSHTFKAGTQFDDILNLYSFDRELRLLTLDAIERFEVSLRTQLAYHLSHNYKSSHPHLLPEIFYDPVKYSTSLSKLNEEIKRSKEKFIAHFSKKYEEAQPPIWTVVELMTMGQLSKWFSNIGKRSDKNDISEVYGLDEKIMTSYCEHLSLVRNHAAHHSRLWNREFTKTFVLPKRGDIQLLSSLWIIENTKNSKQDKRPRKLYNTFVMLAYLMNTICGENHWVDRLKSLIAKGLVAR
ncbi:MAG TPA: hypothetical protein DHW71_15125 [Gammaproteobacteria bacterium]|nr:hypothetical protein [Gammaproteobacteria bacterium]HCK94325.1 hypothetical protein [Gammaproteobacteria bacterium]|tara:strand:- start:30 stop:986 length:957 start_codon:yes stop_codon:yes gene_type:complete